jgi:hypothetical protein
LAIVIVIDRSNILSSFNILNFNFRCHLQQRVRFHNTGPSLAYGVIVMSIEDGHDGFPGLSQLDPMYVKTYCNLFLWWLEREHVLILLTFMLGRYSFIVVVFNASPQDVSFVSPSLQSRNLQLHPIQVQSIASSIARNLSISNFKRGVQF